MRRCFYHTDLGQNAVFHNFAIQIALIQYSGRSKQPWAFSETYYLNRFVAYSGLMLYGPNLKGSRFESVAPFIRFRTHNFNSYLSQKLSENVVVIQWQPVHQSLLQSNFL